MSLNIRVKESMKFTDETQLRSRKAIQRINGFMVNEYVNERMNEERRKEIQKKKNKDLTQLVRP